MATQEALTDDRNRFNEFAIERIKEILNTPEPDNYNWEDLSEQDQYETLRFTLKRVKEVLGDHEEWETDSDIPTFDRIGRMNFTISRAKNLLNGDFLEPTKPVHGGDSSRDLFERYRPRIIRQIEGMQDRLPFVGYTYYRDSCLNRVIGEDASTDTLRDVMDWLSDEGVIEIYQVQVPEREFPVSAIRLAEAKPTE